MAKQGYTIPESIMHRVHRDMENILGTTLRYLGDENHQKKAVRARNVAKGHMKTEYKKLISTINPQMVTLSEKDIKEIDAGFKAIHKMLEKRILPYYERFAQGYADFIKTVAKEHAEVAERNQRRKGVE